MQNFLSVKIAVMMTDQGFSIREIGSRIKAGHSAVQTIQRRWKESGKTVNEIQSMNESELLALIYPGSTRRPSKPLPDFEKIYKEVVSKENKKDIYFFWEKYRLEHPDGYMYTQFCEYFRRYIKDNHPEKLAVMRLNRRPGENLYIDWAGDTLDLVRDPKNPDKLQKAHFFVTTLGHSSMLFCEAFPDEKENSFIQGTVDAIHFYGAIPRVLKPDNAKTAVIKHTDDDVVINAAFLELEDYYGVTIVPAPPLKPKGKSTVENGVNWVERKVLEELRGKTYSSFKQLNQEIIEIVNRLNEKKKKGEFKGRRQLFEEIDKPKMRPLTQQPYRVCEIRAFTLSDEYFVKVDGNYYSVPYQYLFKTLLVHHDNEDVWITTESNEEIARHKKDWSGPGQYITIDDHMPSAHKFYKEINDSNIQTYYDWASRIGPSMRTFIERVLHHTNAAPETYFRSCKGILHTAKTNPALGEEVAAECLKNNHIGYRYFTKKFKEREKETKSFQNSNVRGKDYYK